MADNEQFSPLDLDLNTDVVALTKAICDVESVSGNERKLADMVERALRQLGHLKVMRDGDSIVAQTRLGRAQRVIIAGHLDTVPVAGNLPVVIEGAGPSERLIGRGTVDMKAGVAVQLALAAELSAPSRDVTWIFYDHEEVEATKNGLGRLVAKHPEWITGDFAVLGEPTSAGIEGGCNGTLRAEVRTAGVAAHSARAWIGHNAIHDAGSVLERLAAYEPQSIDVDGLVYREGLNAVMIRGGVAGNVIPDECVVTVNYRFAPSRSIAEAEAHVRDVFDGYRVTLTDVAAGARPGLDHPAAAAFVAAIQATTGRGPAPKYGWTDVARFSALGVPAVNFGPGDPLKAHADDEFCQSEEIRLCHQALRDWLV